MICNSFPQKRFQLSSYLGDQGWGRNTHKRYGKGATDSDDDDMSVKSYDSKEKTSIIRKQLVDNMDKAIANLDSSTETDSSLKHSKPAISERLKNSANVINCSLDQIIKLVKCEECEFVATNKKGLTWHVRKHHNVLESDESEGNNSTKRRRKKT